MNYCSPQPKHPVALATQKVEPLPLKLGPLLQPIAILQKLFQSFRASFVRQLKSTFNSQFLLCWIKSTPLLISCSLVVVISRSKLNSRGMDRIQQKPHFAANEVRDTDTLLLNRFRDRVQIKGPATHHFKCPKQPGCSWQLLSSKNKRPSESQDCLQCRQLSLDSVFLPRLRGQTHLTRYVPRSDQNTEAGNGPADGVTNKCLPTPNAIQVFRHHADQNYQQNAEEQERKGEKVVALIHAAKVPPPTAFVERVAA